jgi:hypothetical protein
MRALLRLPLALLIVLAASTGAHAQSKPAGNHDRTVLPVWNKGSGKVEALLYLEPTGEQAVGARWHFGRNSLDAAFGLSSGDVIERYRRRDYAPQVFYAADPHLKAAVDFLTGDAMRAQGDAASLSRLRDELVNKDWFMTFPDFEDYCETKARMLRDSLDGRAWAQKMLVNIAKAGYFSSDRTIADYNREIWQLG